MAGAPLHRTPTSLPPTAARRSLYHARLTLSKEGRAPPACGVRLATNVSAAQATL